MTAGSGFRRKEGRDGGINREEWGGKEGSESFIVDPLVELCQWPYNCLNFRVLSFIQSVFFFFRACKQCLVSISYQRFIQLNHQVSLYTAILYPGTTQGCANI